MRRLKKRAGFWGRNLRLKAAALGLPLTWNEKSFLELKDRHRGSRAFVIGNGPSLKTQDLDRLQGEVTMASNKIFLAFDQTAWRPTYHFVEDQIVFQQSLEILRGQKHQLLVRGFSEAFAEEIPGALRYYLKVEKDVQEPSFEMRPAGQVCCGYTVLYSALQMAFFMGIETVYLLGVDHSYAKENVVDRSGPLEVCRQGDQPNHFHPDYYSKGMLWQFPDMEKQMAAFRKAGAVYQAHGRKILNATRGGALELFPRVSLDEVLGS